MRKLILFLSTFLCILACTAQSVGYDLNCSTIIVGKDASASGFVMVAHNEDDGGNQIVNFYKFPSKDNQTGRIM